MRIPKIVYKYRDWTNVYHSEILTKNQLYLASPKDFNDPFDCRINANLSLLSPQEEYQYINELAISGFAESEKRGKNIESLIKSLECKFKEKQELQKQDDALLFKYQDESFAIFSCTRKWDNILMWSHYANCHEGFCIGFWSKKLEDSGYFGKIGRVKYESTFPEIKPRVSKKDDQLIQKAFIQTHTKAKTWRYESEFRFMSNLFPKVLTLADRIRFVPDEFIAEVILGINMPEKHKKLIQQKCREKNIPVFQAKKVDFKFKIDRIRIQE